ALGYYQEPSKREVGFVIGLIATVICLLGTGYGLVITLIG
ncbi:MAG TPA: MAPEG domain-containing protein, partial [Halieaceae bacterium]|nr:MAPEG domain-containing protein [Halieaceae bacterium]